MFLSLEREVLLWLVQNFEKVEKDGWRWKEFFQDATGSDSALELANKEGR